MADPIPDPDTILSTIIGPTLDVLGDRVVRCEGEERLNYWSAFKRLFEVYPGKDVKYGFIYNRSMIGNLLVVLTRAQQRQKGHDLPPTDLPLPDMAFSNWEEDDWDMLCQYLHAIVENLKRQDADASIGQVENKEIHVELAQTDAFTSKVRDTMHMIMMNKVVAPIRDSLEGQLAHGNFSDTDYPKLDESMVERMWENIANEDEEIQERILRKLFQESATASSDRRPEFKTIRELRKVFNDKPFEFNELVNSIEVTVEDCNEMALHEPFLNDYYFRNDAEPLLYQEDNSQDDGEEEPREDRSLRVSPDVITRLREARHALREEGDDPLPECIRLANAVTRKGSATNSKSRGIQQLREQPQNRRRRGSRLYKKRKSAVRLEFDDDSSYIDDDEVEKGSPGLNRDGRINLSNLPPQVAHTDEELTPSKKKLRGSQQKKYDGKRPWTAEEKGAIIQGVITYGKGNWAMIKKKYDVLFELRTSGQIKDCFRSMMKRGEVPDDLLDEPVNE